MSVSRRRGGRAEGRCRRPGRCAQPLPSPLQQMERPGPSTAPSSSAEPTQTPARRWVPGASGLGQRAGKGRWPVDPRHSHQGQAPGAACPLTPPRPSPAGPKWKPAEISPGGERGCEGVAGGGGRSQAEKREPVWEGGGRLHASESGVPLSPRPHLPAGGSAPLRQPGPIPTPLCPQEALQRLVSLYGLLHGLQVSGGHQSRGRSRPARPGRPSPGGAPGSRDLARGRGEGQKGRGRPRARLFPSPRRRRWRSRTL